MPPRSATKAWLARGLFVLGLATVLAAGSARAALDMFLDLGPGISGESTDAQFPGKVNVLAWSWGMANSGTTQSGTGAGAGKASCQDLSITKYVDKSSPPLMLNCATGKLLSQVILSVRRSVGGSNSYIYIKMTLTNVLVTSVSTGGSGGEDRLTENITLNFSKIKYEYTPLKSDGTPDSTLSVTWDIVAQTAA